MEAGASGEHGNRVPDPVEVEWCSPTESAPIHLLKTVENTVWPESEVSVLQQTDLWE